MYIKTVKFLVLSVCIGLTGCGVLPESKSPEERVKERAQLWMDSMIALDFDAAWDLVSPGYKELWKIGNYRAHYRGAEWWLRGEMGRVTCQPESPPDESAPTECTALLYITYQAPTLAMELRRTFKTEWLFVDGDWYKYED